MTPNDAIVYALTGGGQLVRRFVEDLKPEEFLHRPSPNANCVAWVVGHLALSDRNALKRLGASLPELPAGFEHRFSRDEGCPQAKEFGDVSNLLSIFEDHRRRLIEAVRSATPEQLDRPVDPPHPRFKTPGEFATFMGLHSAMHAGQITLIRRSLGKPPII